MSTPAFQYREWIDSLHGLDFLTSCTLPTPWAVFELHAFVERSTGKEHLAITLCEISDGHPVLSRIHSECLTGDALFSQRCDCGAQLEYALKGIAAEGCGLLLYLKQEGRGIGLINKVRAYRLQDAGADAVQANLQLGFAADRLCEPMLTHFNITKLQLITNNPRNVEAIEQMGISVIERIFLVVNTTHFNRRFLATNAARLGHAIPDDDTSE